MICILTFDKSKFHTFDYKLLYLSTNQNYDDMKKLFTLSIVIFCVVALNAQFTETGNGFLERFDYPDGTVYDDVVYEGIGAEWPAGAVIENSTLKWELPFEEEVEGWFAMWEIELDLSENTEISFKYKFPAGTQGEEGNVRFGIWIETTEGGGEIWPDDFLLGLDEFMPYTFDLSTYKYFETETPMDLTKPVIEIWIGAYSEEAGTFYLDDLVIGDGWTLTSIPGKLVKRGLQVYPNPASEAFRIDADIQSLSVYNSIGQVVYSVEDYRKGSSVDISDLEEGLYFIQADDTAHKLLVK